MYEHCLSRLEVTCSADRETGNSRGKNNGDSRFEAIRYGGHMLFSHDNTLGKCAVRWTYSAKTDQRSILQRSHTVEAGNSWQRLGKCTGGEVMSCNDFAIQVLNRDCLDIDHHLAIAGNGIGKVFVTREVANLMNHSSLHLTPL